MEICIDNNAKCELFTSVFQNIRPFTDHVSIAFSSTGVYLQTMDAARVSIIELNIPNTWFDKYEFSKAGDIVLGISVNIFFKILNAREKTQTIQIIYNNDEKTGSNDILSLHFTSNDKTIFDKHFQCPLLEIESELMQIPEIEYAAEFSLPSSMFATLLHQLKTFGDSLDILCTEENIILSSNSTENGKMSVEIKIDDLSAFSINENEQIQLSYSLTQLHNISLFHKISKEVTIGLCDQYPMSIQYPFTEDNSGCLRAYLAPKMSDDE
jgi:proliferating cell nuclear antigen PCNA